MGAVARLKNLANLPKEKQLSALAQAINLELSLPSMALDLQGGKAANDETVSLLGERKRPELPSMEAVKAALHQKYATPTDTPQSSDVAARVVQWNNAGLRELDLGWTNLFRLVDMRGGNQDAFEINTGEFGITFKQRAPGEATEIWRLPSETELLVKYITYSAGAGILDDWLRFNKWWRIDEIIAEIRSKAWAKKADDHYGLLTALGAGINVAHESGDDLGTATLNKAGASIYRALADRGVSANTPLWIVTSPEKRGDILRMLEATQGSLIVAYQNGQPIAISVAGVIATTRIPSNATSYYLVLPDQKMVRGDWMDLSIEEDRDIYKRAQDWVATMQYNAVVGDSAQVRRVAFA